MPTTAIAKNDVVFRKEACVHKNVMEEVNVLIMTEDLQKGMMICGLPP